MKRNSILTISILLICTLFLIGCATQGDTPNETADSELAADAVPSPGETTPSTQPEPAPEPGTAPAYNQGPVELIVGAAMSLKDVAEALGEAYTAENPQTTVVFTFASSGALQTQIEQGAPIDVFISAATRQMQNLEDRGLIEGQSRNLVTNAVVLVVPTDSNIRITSFADVADPSISLVGVGDPETVPIGTFARDIFRALGIEDEVYAKAILASDTRQVLTWVETGEVDAGVVFKTDALSSDGVRVVQQADSSLHTPSVNPVGVIADGPYITESQRFVDFLFSSEAAVIFESYGFSMY